MGEEEEKEGREEAEGWRSVRVSVPVGARSLQVSCSHLERGNLLVPLLPRGLQALNSTQQPRLLLTELTHSQGQHTHALTCATTACTVQTSPLAPLCLQTYRLPLSPL